MAPPDGTGGAERMIYDSIRRFVDTELGDIVEKANLPPQAQEVLRQQATSFLETAKLVESWAPQLTGAGMSHGGG